MSRERRKGTDWERALLAPLAELWPEIRRTGSALQALGDFEGTAPFVIEAKDRQKIELAAFVDQASAAAIRAVGSLSDHVPAQLPAVIVKRRRQFITQAYVIQPLWAWLQSIDPAGRRKR